VPHHRARHTPLGRWEVIRRVVEEGETFAQAAAWANVSKSTVWEWVRRWRQATEEDRASLACMAERSSRPHRSPARLPAEEEQRICELRRRTGWSPRRIARRGRAPARDRPPGPAAWRLLAPPGARAPGRRALRVAVPRQPAAHRRQEVRQVHRTRPQDDRRPHPALKASRVGPGAGARGRRAMHAAAVVATAARLHVDVIGPRSAARRRRPGPSVPAHGGQVLVSP
jgi:transposase-like protein